ncbi:SoxY-related AACIE arm protein [Aquabacterium sp. OR-4]|uniref:SoxY-related AACIE arm protein n=1 Tax=Aquabacterium sp. OR-4 TaxID=2978127 RepID=UPI0021B26AD0|nr:SoxY-related AACIE arm protein [Aquabacterium sp. OR-4]MDT7835887.1 SoxY-related AACIE arm protein [Aquabacterium sp. OR-4]
MSRALPRRYLPGQHLPGQGLPRRRLLAGGALLALTLRPAGAQPLAETLQRAMAEFAAGAAVREGRVLLDVAPLVDNGNAVPVSVTVDVPQTAAAHATELVLFNEKNPQRDVMRCRLGPACGRAAMATRIRLATSQRLVAMARLNDGSVWQHTVQVVVTLAACIEGES